VSAFYEPSGDGRFRATPATAGPWDSASQHAGPPAALLGRALERCAARPEMLLARLTFDILGPVPVAEVEVEARVVRAGRSVELLQAELRSDGRPAMRATAWRTLAAGAPSVAADGTPPPRPATGLPPPPEWNADGYLTAMEWRFAAGAWAEPGPAAAWGRMRVALVAGEEPTGLQRMLTVADSGNGISWLLPIEEWLFINPELSVHVLREPCGEWICLDAQTRIAHGGAALARSVLFDDDGPVAYGAQSLLVTPRPPRAGGGAPTRASRSPPPRPR
jgi:hypothetical protein